MNWQDFEEECLKYLKVKYGDFFTLFGKSNSNVSDICFDNRINKFYIEVKMPHSQCGQFVLLPDIATKRFRYSDKNKSKSNKASDAIVDYMNLNYEEFLESGTAGVEIMLDKEVFYDWVINFYREKNVKYIITKSKDDFLIVPIEKFGDYFDVFAIY